MHFVGAFSPTDWYYKEGLIYFKIVYEGHPIKNETFSIAQ